MGQPEVRTTLPAGHTHINTADAQLFGSLYRKLGTFGPKSVLWVEIWPVPRSHFRPTPLQFRPGQAIFRSQARKISASVRSSCVGFCPVWLGPRSRLGPGHVLPAGQQPGRQRVVQLPGAPVAGDQEGGTEPRGSFSISLEQREGAWDDDWPPASGGKPEDRTWRSSSSTSGERPWHSCLTSPQCRTMC
jgi:hypothetical protein